MASLLYILLWIMAMVFYGSLSLKEGTIPIDLLIGLAFVPHFWCMQGFELLSKWDYEGQYT